MTLDELKSSLWGAAVLLRGKINATGYKEYIFPLVFFKRISDVHTCGGDPFLGDHVYQPVRGIIDIIEHLEPYRIVLHLDHRVDAFIPLSDPKDRI